MQGRLSGKPGSLFFLRGGLDAFSCGGFALSMTLRFGVLIKNQYWNRIKVLVLSAAVRQAGMNAAHRVLRILVKHGCTQISILQGVCRFFSGDFSGRFFLRSAYLCESV